MKEYRFDELRIGQQAELEVAITADLVARFAAITGDINPLHTDALHARAKGFPQVVAHGMLLSSFVSTLVGMHLPGKFALLHGVKLSFHHPVLAGDVVRFAAEVHHLNEAHRQVELKITVTNQRGERVARGTVQVGVDD